MGILELLLEERGTFEGGGLPGHQSLTQFVILLQGSEIIFFLGDYLLGMKITSNANKYKTS